MSLQSYVKSLCTPAYVYLVMSVISLVMIMLQNAGNTTEYCAGNFACDVSSTGIVLLVHGLYIMFWTFVLNSICQAGYKNLSWFILLLPFVLGFILIGLFILNQGVVHKTY